TTQCFSQKIIKSSYYSNHPELGGEVIIKQSTTEIVNDKSIISFEVEAPNSGDYYLSFWILPVKLNDGTYVNYDVSVNGNMQRDKIIPQRGDWQSITLSSKNKIKLNKGTNTISIIGKVPLIPNVEHVRIASNLQESKIKGDLYQSYKASIERENVDRGLKNTTNITDSIFNKSNLNVTKASSWIPPYWGENPLYEYGFGLNMICKYTFYQTFHFSEGQPVSIKTTGINNIAHVVEVFSCDFPENYSWKKLSSNNNFTTSLSLTIPYTGDYIVRVRSYYSETSGLCDININNRYYYDSMPIYTNGIRCTQDTLFYYNSFTCNNTCDPVLWIEEGESPPGKISAFSYNYVGNGNFSWGGNSRIYKQYPRPVHAALISSRYSYGPIGTCDLYAKCRNSDVWTRQAYYGLPEASLIYCYPNYHYNDAIQSSSEVDHHYYNCISWSGGITSYWEWPLGSASTFYSVDSLTAFDNFYASRGLTRVGATEENSVVDLWAGPDLCWENDSTPPSGFVEFTHASVRKGADSFAHGYDWESKCGSDFRVFHPRYALSGPAYGNVVQHYIKINENTPSFEEELANGTSRIEYVDYNSCEKEFISNKIDIINRDVLSRFNTLYDKWDTITAHTIYSNPKQIANCQEYKELLDLCKQNKDLIYAVYDKLGKESNISAVTLVEDLTLGIKQNQDIMQRVRNESVAKLNQKDCKIIRPIHSNVMLYVKELLALEKSELYKEDKSNDSSYNNNADFSVSSLSNNISIDFTLSESSKVTLNILDLNNNVVANIVNNNILDSGKHSYSMSLTKSGIYIVQLFINGRVNVKKIIINN
nr:hypothetical protein [Bacteroidaceae bacterium]